MALDFFAVGLLNGSRGYVLAVIEHGNRRIRLLRATENPVQPWVVQQAQDLLIDCGTNQRLQPELRDDLRRYPPGRVSRDSEPRPSACDTAGKADRLRRSGHNQEPIVWFFFIEYVYEKWWS
jgi:hypothetical protein